MPDTILVVPPKIVSVVTKSNVAVPLFTLSYLGILNTAAALVMLPLTFITTIILIFVC